MNRTFRGVWAHRGTLLPLLLVTATVVAGTVAVLALGEAIGSSSAVVVPLLLLGLVAVPDTGRQLAAVRRREIAIGRLRGVTGRRLWAVLALEPLLVLVAGALVGLALGAGTALVVAHVWFGEPAVITSSVGPPVSVIVAGGLVAVLAGMGGRLHEPLGEQIRTAERPRPASTATLFLNVLVLVAAVVATYRATAVSVDDPGWVVLAGPALVGLAVGQAALWLVRPGAAVAVRHTRGGRLASFLAARQLRAAHVADPVRLLVAAAVLGAVSLTGALEVDEWTEDTARMRAAAPYQVVVDGEVTDALALAADLDPAGRWLMAAAFVPGEGSVPARRAFVDTARYDAVVGRFLDGTPADGVARHLDALGEGARFAGAGDTVSATVRGVSGRSTGRLRPRVVLTYRNDRGVSSAVTLRLRIGLDGSATTGELAVPDCRGGCVATRLTLDRAAGDASVPWVLTRLDLGDLDALDRGWRPVVRQLPAGVVEDEVTTVDDGLLVPPVDRPLEAFAAGGGAAVPVLATDSASWDGPPMLDSPGGEERPAAVLDRLPALPLVEADGVLADLATAAEGAPLTVPAAVVLVLAAGDTPPDLLTALAERAAADVTHVDEVEDLTSAEVGATQARMYAVIAGFCLVLAVVVLVSGNARRLAQRRHDTAALRVVGVPAGTLRAADRRQLGVLAAVTAAATVGGALVGVVLLLGNLALVSPPEHSAPLQIGFAAGPVIATALVASALVLVLGLGFGRVGSEKSRPAILREADR